ncbi:unnamed protein product [Caenorhabditis sp. 36 PRJEB53466]|nr:unnamed protein product [Caenorhabditis sp. 36 PRJEB53466]
MSKAKEDLGKSDKRPPSSLSTGSADSGVFSSGVHVSPSHSQRSEGSSDSQSGPPSPTAQLNSLIFQTANLIAVNEQLRKEIAENKQIQNIQMRALNRLSAPPDQSFVHPHQTGFPHSRAPRGERRMQKPESYKTVICQAWLESKTCTFAENCRFAHGEEELRPSKIEPRQNNKYKTKLCDKYTTTGLCPYGKRCLFIHPDHGPNAYIRADKLFEVSQRHALADLRDQMETQIMTGGRNSFTQLPPPLIPEAQFVGKPPQMEAKANYGNVRAPVPQMSCESARPHPSWPLESSSLFSPPESSLRSNGTISPFEQVFPGQTGIQQYFMPGKPGDLFHSNQLLNPLQSEDDSLSTIPGFDHLAEDMAKHLELW